MTGSGSPGVAMMAGWPGVETVVELAVGGSCRFLFSFFFLSTAFGSLPLPSAVLLLLFTGGGGAAWRRCYCGDD